MARRAPRHCTTESNFCIKVFKSVCTTELLSLDCPSNPLSRCYNHPPGALLEFGPGLHCQPDK